MAVTKLVHEADKEFDCSLLHGKYATITMHGQDVGYARVGIVSSGGNYVLFRFRGRLGVAYKPYIKDITEVRMTERMLKKEPPFSVEAWDPELNPYFRFVGLRCDIHLHQTRMFEATPGFFRAKILYVDEQNGLIRIKENSKQFNVKMHMICGMLECE